MADDSLSDEAIAAEVGVSRKTLALWKLHPDFAAKVGDHVGRLQAEMLKYRIAKKRERLRVLNDLHEKQLAVIAARAADAWHADVPGGETGLVVKQLKTVKHAYEPDPDDEDGRHRSYTAEQWEAAVDTALIREIRATEEQAAKELGQWVEKREDHHTGVTFADLFALAEADAGAGPDGRRTGG